jgi:molybdopterin converting factor small subunit
MAIIKIPSQLRPQTEGHDQVEIPATTVGEALNKLVEQHPSIKDRIYDENGKLRRYVNIYLGDEDIRFLENLETKIEAKSELSLVPAIAGGRNTRD